MKMMKILVLLVIVSLYKTNLTAQITQKYLNVDMGITGFVNELPTNMKIRGDVPKYYYGNETSTKMVNGFMQRNFIGLKAEIVVRDKFGWSMGVRFSQMESSITKNNNYGNDYFYLVTKETATSSEFMKVRHINQSSNYVGVPIEFRYFPYMPRKFRVFIKLAAEGTILLQTKKSVSFGDDAMAKYENDVTRNIKDPAKLSSLLYGGFGIKYGQKSKPSISIEFSGPAWFASYKSNGMLNPVVGGGVQVNIQIPIGSKPEEVIK